MDAPDKVPVRISLIDPEINNAQGKPSPSRLPRKLVENTRLLWSHRELLRRVTLYALGATILLAFLIPKRYEATTQLMPPENISSGALGMLGTLGARGAESSGFGGSIGGAALGGVASDLLGMKNTGALFVSILWSRTVSDRLIEQFQLNKDYHTKLIEDTRLELWEHVDISEQRKSGVIEITVTDKDPQRAAGMAQAYVTELNRLVAEVSTSSARRERIFLEDRLKTVKAALDNATVRFSEFASTNTAIDVPAQGKAMVEAAAWLQGQLIFEESELRGLEQIYAPGNVRLQAHQARVAELKQQLAKLGGSDSPSEVKNDHSLYPSIRKLPLLGATYFDLYRETKVQETLYQLLTQEYELAKVEEAKQIPTVSVLDAAVVPTKKSFPPRTRIVVSGTLLALAGTVLWIFLRTWWSGIVPDDPGRELAEEMGASFRASTWRLRPLGSALRRTAARVKRLGGKEAIAPDLPPEGEPDKEAETISDVPVSRL
jgi:capsule polysaccharide export protein KpsE/RkpR